MRHILLSLLILLTACKTMTPEEKRAFWEKKMLSPTPGTVLVFGRMETWRSNLISGTVADRSCTGVVLEPKGGGATQSYGSIDNFMFLEQSGSEMRPFVIEAAPGYYEVKLVCANDRAITGHGVSIKRDARFIYIGDFKSMVGNALLDNSGENIAANIGMMALVGSSATMTVRSDTKVYNKAEEAAEQLDDYIGVDNLPPMAHAIAYPGAY